MNIIEALQALRDGKKIRITEWNDKRRYYCLKGDRLVDESGKAEDINIRTSYVLVDDIWEIYTEPLKLTPEEIKALKLARDCGFADISRSSETDYTILFNYAKFGMDYCLCAHEVPSFAVLCDANWINGKGQSISELLARYKEERD
jgi:hypothetical protein